MINVTDTETSGFDHAENGVCELAVVHVDLDRPDVPDDWFQSLIDPGHPIGCEAMGTHHITNEMVAGCQSLETALTKVDLWEKCDVWAAHNAKFDSGFFPQSFRDRRWICTWRCAMHLWPDAPSHKNQALRYWLKLDISDMPASAGSSAHRALYDAWVTAKLLRRMIDEVIYTWTAHDGPGGTQEQAIEHLIEMSTKPLLLKKFRFGKHRDEPVDTIDKGYLRWCLRQDFDEDVIHTCKYHLGLLV